MQQLSGTYTIQLGPNILDTLGDALDTNQNAGLAVIAGFGSEQPDHHRQIPVGRSAQADPGTRHQRRFDGQLQHHRA